MLIADLGYFVPGSFKQINEAQAYFISRYKADTNIYDVDTNCKLDLLALLENKSSLVHEVFLGKEAKIKVRIICHKLSTEQSAARRRKANALAKAHGYKSSQRNQKLLDWSIFITNIPEEKICGEYIGHIYRVRWQIELLFKLYKSHIKIETLKARNNSSRVLCELYAKLCAIIIFHYISGCTKLDGSTEISLIKALIEFKNRSRELFYIINRPLTKLYHFLRNLTLSWSKFCLKDRKRKKRISTLSTLRSITVMS